MSKLEAVIPLRPAFVSPSDDALRQAEREAARLTEAQRRKAALQKQRMQRQRQALQQQQRDDQLKKKEAAKKHGLARKQVLDKQQRAAETAKKQAQERAARRADFFKKRGQPVPAPRPSWAHGADRQAFQADYSKLARAVAQDKKQVRAQTDREARKAAFIAMRRGGAAQEPVKAQGIVQSVTPSPAQNKSLSTHQNRAAGMSQSAAATARATQAQRPTSYAKTIKPLAHTRTRAPSLGR